MKNKKIVAFDRSVHKNSQKKFNNLPTPKSHLLILWNLSAYFLLLCLYLFTVLLFDLYIISLLKKCNE